MNRSKIFLGVTITGLVVLLNPVAIVAGVVIAIVFHRRLQQIAPAHKELFSISLLTYLYVFLTVVALGVATSLLPHWNLLYSSFLYVVFRLPIGTLLAVYLILFRGIYGSEIARPSPSWWTRDIWAFYVMLGAFVAMSVVGAMSKPLWKTGMSFPVPLLAVSFFPLVIRCLVSTDSTIRWRALAGTVVSYWIFTLIGVSEIVGTAAVDVMKVVLRHV